MKLTKKQIIEYAELFECELESHKNWRLGQTAFNVLCDIHPLLAEKVRGNGDIDPFYVDKHIPKFFEFIMKANDYKHIAKRLPKFK